MRIIVLLISLFLVAAPAQAFDEVISSKDLYEANCAVCHGLDGVPTEEGKKLEPFPARDLSALSSLVERDELRRIITYGVRGTVMSPKQYTLDALEIDSVIDYIQTLKYTPDLERAKKRFIQVCATCHGTDGRAQTGMGAKNLVYSKLDIEGIIHTMRFGRPGTIMTSKRHQLSNPEIADIAQYVYNLRLQGDAEKGAVFYGKECVSCHKTVNDIKLIGNRASRRSLADLDDHMLDLRIRHGRHIDRAKNIAKISADDVQHIIAYLRKETSGE
ncbi:MAG: c-type cytochrome [Mariprofundales bacterium]